MIMKSFSYLQQKKNENECIYSNLCILPPYQGSYDAFLVDFGKLLHCSHV